MNYYAKHANLESTYTRYRKYKPVGVKLNNRLWLNKTEDGNFTISSVSSKYYTAEDGKVYHAGVRDRDKWTMTVLATVYPTYAELVADQHVAALMGFRCTKIKSSKLVGTSWEDSSTGTITNVGTGGKLIIAETGTSASIPPLMRVHIKDAQKELNEHIKTVRRMLKVRALLGVFKNVSLLDMMTKYNANAVSANTGYVGSPLPKQLNAELMAVREDDFTTLLPVLMHSMVSVGYSAEYYWHKDGFNTSPAVMLRAFNNFINRRKEDLRKLNGAVEYVQATEERAEA